MRLVTVLLLTVSLFFGCGNKKEVSFREDIQPILKERCVQCHGTEVQQGRVTMATYQALMDSRTRSGRKPPVVPGNPNESRLYILIATNQVEFRMPPDTSRIPPLAPDQVKQIGRWIMQGAKDN